LYTGDLAKIDEDGFIYIVSRKKDMIKSGANRISPLEIENVVCGFPGVVECAAVGIPDEILGETIKLFVILNGHCATEKDILIFCKQNLASYKLPKEIKIVESLPKTASGKIKRDDLRQKR
jgi:acyl-coenzyme A synthetase/AMP-(fatty) acid ligase